MIDNQIFTTSLSVAEITPKIAADYIKRHINSDLPRLQRMFDYYNGKHDILNRVKQGDGLSNNQLVAAFPSYIANFTSGYLLGVPVAYSSDENIDDMINTLENADSATQDADLALDAAIFGRAYELVYMSTDAAPKPKLARLSPLNTFVVYDDTVEQKPVFAVYYFPVYDANGSETGKKGRILTDSTIQEIQLDSTGNVKPVTEPMPHYFGMVPVDEIYNDGQRRGDFENVISLIDAYNILQSDRVNDKEQFVNALLLIKGAHLGADADESLETYKKLKEYGVLELPFQNADASYLTRQFDESSVEILRKAIADDIHKFSAVPDMTDDSFSGNASGVAIKYKLLNLEQRTKIKERYFAEGLRYRLECLSNVPGTRAVDVSKVNITFKRALPSNEMEEAQKAATLQGIVPQELILSQLSFISDPKEAAEMLNEEKTQAAEQQRQAFMNTPISEM